MGRMMGEVTHDCPSAIRTRGVPSQPPLAHRARRRRAGARPAPHASSGTTRLARKTSTVAEPSGGRVLSAAELLSIPRSGILHGTSSSRSSSCSCQVRLYYEGLMTSPAVRRVLD
jgi:hypothetical protein